MEQILAVLGLVLAPATVVELIRQGFQGLRARARAKHKKVTEFDLLVESRRRYREHAEILRARAIQNGCTELPAWPEDVWPPKDTEE